MMSFRLEFRDLEINKLEFWTKMTHRRKFRGLEVKNESLEQDDTSVQV